MFGRKNNRWSDHLSRRLLALGLVLAQVFALFVAPVHHVAHAQAGASAAAVTSLTPASPRSHDHSWLHLFGHEAGRDCEDWNAAFAPDINPGANADFAPLAISAPALRILAPDTRRPLHPLGLCRARAPPRR